MLLKTRAKNTKSLGKEVLKTEKAFHSKFLKIMKMLLIFPLALLILRTNILTLNSSEYNLKKDVRLKELCINNGNLSTMKYFRISGE
jgi:hypothetical protein